MSAAAGGGAAAAGGGALSIAGSDFLSAAAGSAAGGTAPPMGLRVLVPPPAWLAAAAPVYAPFAGGALVQSPPMAQHAPAVALPLLLTNTGGTGGSGSGGRQPSAAGDAMDVEPPLQAQLAAARAHMQRQAKARVPALAAASQASAITVVEQHNQAMRDAAINIALVMLYRDERNVNGHVAYVLIVLFEGRDGAAPGLAGSSKGGEARRCLLLHGCPLPLPLPPMPPVFVSSKGSATAGACCAMGGDCSAAAGSAAARGGREKWRRREGVGAAGAPVAEERICKQEWDGRSAALAQLALRVKGVVMKKQASDDDTCIVQMSEEEADVLQYAYGANLHCDSPRYPHCHSYAANSPSTQVLMSKEEADALQHVYGTKLAGKGVLLKLLQAADAAERCARRSVGSGCSTRSTCGMRASHAKSAEPPTREAQDTVGSAPGAETAAAKLPPRELAALFELFDADGSGTVDGAEFLSLFFKVTDELRIDGLRAQRMAAYRRRYMKEHNIIDAALLDKDLLLGDSDDDDAAPTSTVGGPHTSPMSHRALTTDPLKRVHDVTLATSPPFLSSATTEDTLDLGRPSAAPDSPQTASPPPPPPPPPPPLPPPVAATLPRLWRRLAAALYVRGGVRGAVFEGVRANGPYGAERLRALVRDVARVAVSRAEACAVHEALARDRAATIAHRAEGRAAPDALARDRQAGVDGHDLVDMFRQLCAEEQLRQQRRARRRERRKQLLLQDAVLTKLAVAVKRYYDGGKARPPLSPFKASDALTCKAARCALREVFGLHLRRKDILALCACCSADGAPGGTLDCRRFLRMLTRGANHRRARPVVRQPLPVARHPLAAPPPPLMLSAADVQLQLEPPTPLQPKAQLVATDDAATGTSPLESEVALAPLQAAKLLPVSDADDDSDYMIVADNDVMDGRELPVRALVAGGDPCVIC
ncbi:hypothetical protein JKP88DRAFT_348283 [Tribonema minus]|uniref:EF-hand domain-containing protein n=1 Tax=Tribonema minus TaxID=303371 RepID=A0A835Z2M1_9STRA|nr:hypothetical protein JKP88DRAFT_348283 [Tribonema minus]